jgi:hypothetical protein
MAYDPQPIQIKNFFGGISDDPRKPSVNEFQITKHFDIFSQPNRLIPYRSLEADTNDGSTATGMKQYFVRDFVYHSTSSKLFGLGQTGAGLTKIVYKDDATTGNWTLPSSSEGNGAVKNGCFLEYKGKMLGFQGTTSVFSWDIATTTITNAAATVGATITSVAQGIIAADANAYLPYNNKLVRVSTSLTYTDAIISVPDNFKITSLTNYGNYLAIGCAPISSFNGVSKVFIWNLSSDLFTETLNFGEGDLRVLETIEGVLVGISDRYLNNSTGAGRGSLLIQTYGGGSPQVEREIFTSALTGKTMPLSKAVKNGRLFFTSKIMTNTAGTTYNEGIWSFGRKNKNYPYVLTLDIIDENVDTDGIEAFGVAGNYFFISHSNDGSVDKTNDASTYAFTSIYESQIFDFGDPTLTKQLKMFSIYTAPLPSTGSVTVKFKVDDDTSWTTMGSVSTQGEISHDFYNIESSGDNFPGFKEIQFRLESVTGGGEITGFKVEVQPLTGSTGPVQS